MVQKHTGVDCAVVGPSVDVDVYRPRPRQHGDWPGRPLRLSAMIRPATPRRQARFTMEVLAEVQAARGREVEIVLFGSATDDPAFQALPGDFPWRNAGVVNNRAAMAALFNEVDIFVDFSSFQAMGLAALEAMACGASVIVPEASGSSSFAAHESNALMVDTADRSACVAALMRLTHDHDLRKHLQANALISSMQWFPEQAAVRILAALFA